MSHAATAAVTVGRHRARWGMLALLTVGMLFCYAHRGSLSVAAPFMMKDLGFGPAVMGLLLSAFFWSYSLAQVPSGFLVDRFGVGRAYAGGFLLWTIAVAATGLVVNLAMLMAMRMLVGLGQGVAFPASARAVSNWFEPKERGGVTGVYLAGNRLGQAAISAVGAPIAAALGWKALFFISGFAGLLWLLPWLAFTKRYEQPPTEAGSKTKGASTAELVRLLRDSRMAGVFLGFFAYDYVWFLYITWMPGYLAMARKFTPSEIGIYSSLPFVATSIVVVIAGMLGDLLIRKGYGDIRSRKLVISSGMLVACLIVPGAFVEDKHVAIGLLTVSMCGLAIAAPNCWALTQTVCSNSVGTASGIQNLGGNLGGVIAPALTGLIVEITGSFGIAFCVAGGILLAGIAAYWILIPNER